MWGPCQLAVQRGEEAVGRDDDWAVRQRLAILVEAVQVIARGRRLRSALGCSASSSPTQHNPTQPYPNPPYPTLGQDNSIFLP